MDGSTTTPDLEVMFSSAPEAGPAIRDMLGHLGDTWTLLVVGMLEAGPTRYSELKILVPGIPQRMLTLTLKKLERDGLIDRQSYPEIPPCVEYSITSLGRTLLEPALAFAHWARDSGEAIRAARAEYDRR